MPMLIFSFTVGYATYPKDYPHDALVTRQFVLMLISIALGFAVAVVNRNETRFSLAFLGGAAICDVWAVYLLLTRPPQMTQPPNLN
jgi:hypothetical protein